MALKDALYPITLLYTFVFVMQANGNFIFRKLPHNIVLMMNLCIIIVGIQDGVIRVQI